MLVGEARESIARQTERCRRPAPLALCLLYAYLSGSVVLLPSHASSSTPKRRRPDESCLRHWYVCVCFAVSLNTYLVHEPLIGYKRKHLSGKKAAKRQAPYRSLQSR